MELKRLLWLLVFLIYSSEAGIFVSGACTPNPQGGLACLHGGICTKTDKVQDGGEEYSCNCTGTGYAGANCEVFDETVISSAYSDIEQSCRPGYFLQIVQPGYLYTVNMRDMLDHDPMDDDPTKRDYFSEAHDKKDKLVDQGFTGVSESADDEIQEHAKVCHSAVRTMEYTLNAAVGHHGGHYEKIFEEVAIYAEILEDERTEITLTIQTHFESALNRTVNIWLPDAALSSINEMLIEQNHAEIELQIIVLDANPFFDDTSADPDTPIVNILLKEAQSHIPIIVDLLPVPLELTLPFLKTLSDVALEHAKSEQNIRVVSPEDIENNTAEIAIFKINVPHNSLVYISVENVSSSTLNFSMVALRERKPSILDFLDLRINESNGHQAQFETDVLPVNELDGEPILEYFVGFLAMDPVNPNTIQRFSVVFSRVGCVHRDEDRMFWSEDKCIVEVDTIKYKSQEDGDFTSKMPRPDMVTCLCNHLSFYSAVQFIVPIVGNENPPREDVSVLDIESFPIVLVAVCTILTIYIIGLAACAYFDWKDIRGDIGLTIIQELKYGETIHYYLVTIQTGSNCCAGTSSSIGLMIYGDNGKSKSFILNDKTSKDVFRRGAVDTFLVADRDLGSIKKVRVWSDFSGKRPLWYCRKVLIRSITSGKIWYCFVNRWFKNESIEAPASEKDMPKNMFGRYKENIMENFNDANLWFGIFRCKHYSPTHMFTRCQRISCAFGVLTSYLFVDMLVDQTPTEDEGGLFELKGFGKVDLYALAKGFLIVLITAPFEIILVGLFRYIVPYYSETVIMWENVVPAEANHLHSKNYFIPKIAGMEEKSVRIIEGDGDGNAEDDDNNTAFVKKSKIKAGRSPTFDRISKASTRTDSTNFSIPSTDIPTIEHKIQETNNNGSERDDDDDDDDEDDAKKKYRKGKYVYAIKSKSGLHNESREPNNIARLGRRAMIESCRETDPDLFIFEGDHSIVSVEELIDKQLAQGGRTKKPIATDNIGMIPSKSKIQKKKKKQPKPKKEDEQESPWKKTVTEEYLKAIDDQLNQEMEAKKSMQDKTNSIPRTVFEMCLQPMISRPRFSLPWWVRFIAWFLCISSIIICSALTIYYGLHYGYLKSLLWLEAFLDSFFISLFIEQPIMDCIVTLILTIFGKNAKFKERIQVIVKDCEDPVFPKSRKPFRFEVFKYINDKRSYTRRGKSKSKSARKLEDHRDGDMPIIP